MAASAVFPESDLSVMEAHAEEAARLLRSLGNANRLMVLCLLTGGELSVGAINEALPLSQSALSQHLAVLREEGLVSTRREGQTIYYSVPPGPALEVLAVLHGIYCGPQTSPGGKK
ncbi:MAG: metalloregulator ArsR/SmtB family transcription factor [Moraxellaceae bacterium]|nr:metalloregulator ArsR/SmtB family transcription factor [Moraxellaceae bacterium]